MRDNLSLGRGVGRKGFGGMKDSIRERVRNMSILPLFSEEDALVCGSIWGGSNKQDGMPRRLTLQRVKTSSEIDAGFSSVDPTSRIRSSTPRSLSIRAASTSSTMPLSRNMRAAQTAIGGPSAGAPGL